MTDLQSSRDPRIRKVSSALAALSVEALDLVHPPVVRLLLFVVSMATFVSFWYAVLVAETVATPTSVRTPDASTDTPTPARPPVRTIDTQVGISIWRPHLAYTIAPHDPPPPLALPRLHHPFLFSSRWHMQWIGRGDQVDGGELRQDEVSTFERSAVFDYFGG
jgi:hypothetical protein